MDILEIMTKDEITRVRERLNNITDEELKELSTVMFRTFNTLLNIEDMGIEEISEFLEGEEDGQFINSTNLRNEFLRLLDLDIE